MMLILFTPEAVSMHAVTQLMSMHYTLFEDFLLIRNLFIYPKYQLKTSASIPNRDNISMIEIRNVQKLFLLLEMVSIIKTK